MVKKIANTLKQQKIVKKETISKSGIMLMVSAGPIMTVPQALQIWVYKRSAGIFVPTWIAYFLLSIGWLFYGLKKKDKPMFLNALANTLLNLIIVTGALVVRS